MSRQDLIAIGRERGKQEGLDEGKREGKKESRQTGKTESILLFLEAKHGTLPKELRKAVSKLSSAKANRLLTHLPHCETLEDVQAWLDNGA